MAILLGALFGALSPLRPRSINKSHGNSAQAGNQGAKARNAVSGVDKEDASDSDRENNDPGEDDPEDLRARFGLHNLLLELLPMGGLLFRHAEYPIGGARQYVLVFSQHVSRRDWPLVLDVLHGEREQHLPIVRLRLFDILHHLGR